MLRVLSTRSQTPSWAGVIIHKVLTHPETCNLDHKWVEEVVFKLARSSFLAQECDRRSLCKV